MKNSGLKIISFDTATPFCTTAVTEGGVADGRILAAHSLTGLTHSRKLLAAIDMLLHELSLSWQDIDGIAAGLGPGSFTGLRIGLATAKGLAMASGLPLLGCSTLEIVARGCGIRQAGERVIAVLDARKHEVYIEGFLWQADGERCFLQEDIAKMVLSPYDFAALLRNTKGQILLAGDGAALYREVLREELGSKVGTINFAAAAWNQPQAAVLGFLAAERLAEGKTLDIAEVVPFYIRKSDAELNLGKKKR